MKFKHVPLLAVLLSSFAVASLTACGRDESMTVGEKLDATVATVERKTDAASKLIVEGAAEVKHDVRQAAANVSERASDLSLTANANAVLARDAELGALEINVDTRDGNVALHGKVPNAKARKRAAEIVSAIDGVQRVDNQLTVSTN